MGAVDAGVVASPVHGCRRKSFTYQGIPGGPASQHKRVINDCVERGPLKSAVLQLIDSFDQGVSERQALPLTRLLCESGRFSVRLACLSPEGNLRPTIADLDLGEIASYPLTSFYDQNAVKQLRRFVRWLKSSRIDILHTHDFYTN